MSKTTSTHYSQTVTMKAGGEMKVETNNLPPRPKPKKKDKTVFTQKHVDNKFHFTNSTIENCAISNEGPVSFNKTTEVYHEGAEKKQFDIKGGNFAGANLGGEATYNNENSTISAGAGVGDGGIGKRGDWSYNVDLAVLEILKAGVTPDQLLEVLKKGKKIKELWEYVQKCQKSSVRVVFDSFLNYEEEESGEMDTSS